ncbi:hypothetical protein SKAU_G00220400 [Synaphobranchus kaupii]|uniref:Uncharacterized protein n=1 Tax=Synaphobranchus kaupii TaxID=118154 RepID=A0A9Q1FAN5_SYNKA|nr:hypothetical protein SKAU_G00220400 [Synaphobranchus kaupii]
MLVVSNEAVQHAKRKYKTLTEAQRRNLAIAPDDIIFLIPEDVSLFFDSRGTGAASLWSVGRREHFVVRFICFLVAACRKFCYIVVRFWHLSSADVPEDPESARIFKVAEAEGEGPPKRIVTAGYEFHRELTNGAPLDWTVTSIWHWKQLE